MLRIGTDPIGKGHKTRQGPGPRLECSKAGQAREWTGPDNFSQKLESNSGEPNTLGTELRIVRRIIRLCVEFISRWGLTVMARHRGDEGRKTIRILAQDAREKAKQLVLQRPRPQKQRCVTPMSTFRNSHLPAEPCLGPKIRPFGLKTSGNLAQIVQPGQEGRGLDEAILVHTDARPETVDESWSGALPGKCGRRYIQKMVQDRFVERS